MSRDRITTDNGETIESNEVGGIIVFLNFGVEIIIPQNEFIPALLRGLSK